MRGNGSVYRRGRIWWIQYWHHGKQYSESARTTNKTEAGRILRSKIEALDSGRAVPDAKHTVAEAVASYLTNLGMRRGEGAALSARKKTRPVVDSAKRCEKRTSCSVWDQLGTRNKLIVMPSR